MSTTALSPVTVGPDNAVTDLTSLVAGGSATAVTSGNSVSFPNSLNCALVITSTAGQTATLTVGTTVLGQQPPPENVVLAATDLQLLGFFHSALDSPGTSTVTLTFPSAARVVLIQFASVY